jgi:hypothetical protein
VVEELRALLNQLWGARYPDLYESVDDGRPVESVQEAVAHLLTFLHEHQPALGHRRLLYLGWGMAQAVAPNMEYFQPDDNRAQLVLDAVNLFLTEGNLIEQDWATLFPKVTPHSQAEYEATDVFAQLAKALQPSLARHALAEILDDCLEGYAIFPGSRRRRDLFNWVVLEVIPAAWNCRLPQVIYSPEWPWPPGSNER